MQKGGVYKPDKQLFEIFKFWMLSAQVSQKREEWPGDMCPRKYLPATLITQIYMIPASPWNLIVISI